MRWRWLRAWCVAASLLAWPAASEAASVEGLGHLLGYESRSVALGLSGDGSVVSGSSWGGAYTFVPFVYTSTSGMLEVPDIPGGGVRGSALAVSDDGSTVVGWGTRSSDGPDPTDQPQAFHYDVPSGVMTPLGTGTGEFGSMAYGVSADGSVIVGDAGIDPLEGTGVAAIFDPSGGVRAASPNSGPCWHTQGYYCSARAVSADGTITAGRRGEYFDPDFVYSAYAGYRYDEATGGEVIEGLRASAMSNDGGVVVGGGRIWDAELGLRSLGTAPGSSDTYAQDVSGDGATVVGSARVGEELRAFLWTEDDGVRLLEDVLASLGVDTTGWTLLSANAISGDGRVVAGSGLNALGVEEAFRVTLVPEPSTGLLLGLGLLWVGAWRRPT